MSEAPEISPSQESNTGCWLFVMAVVGVLALTYCGKKDETMDPVTTIPDVAVPITPPQPVIEEMSPTELRTGFSHFGKVARAGVTGGAQIYSTNCYAALMKTFRWSALDRCGGFDQAAVRIAENNSSFFDENELVHFETETAASRYLSAAIGGGLASSEADIRFSELQRVSGILGLPKEAAVPSIDEDTGDSATEEIPELQEGGDQTEVDE